MKKFIYISGIVIINLFVVGALFKIMHYPGSAVMIVFAMGLFCFAFLPMAFYQSYKGNGRKNRSIYISGFIVSLFTFLGALLKIQHWPGSALILMVSIPLPFLYFLPVYIYHHNKSKEKSSINFLGVMFLMVYVAVFSSILALQVSRDIFESFSLGEKDFAKTSEIYAIKNNALSENIEKTGGAFDIKRMRLIESKSETIFSAINNIKLELVKAIEGKNSPAIEAGNKINSSAIIAKEESQLTTDLVKGDDGVSCKATELKNQIGDYNKYLKSLLAKDTESANRVGALLNTANITDTIYGNPDGLSWEDQYFPNGNYLICTLTALSDIETNVRMAEAEALEAIGKN